MVQAWLGLRSQRLEAGLRALRPAVAKEDLRAIAAVEKVGVPAAWARAHTALVAPLKPAATSLAAMLGAIHTPMSRGALNAFYDALTALLPDGVRGATLERAVGVVSVELAAFAAADRPVVLNSITELLRAFARAGAEKDVGGAVNAAVAAVARLRELGAERRGLEVAVTALPQLVRATLAPLAPLSLDEARKATRDLATLIVERSPATDENVRIKFAAAPLVELTRLLETAAAALAADARCLRDEPHPARAVVASVRQALEAACAPAFAELRDGAQTLMKGDARTAPARAAMVNAIAVAARAEPAAAPRAIRALVDMQQAICAQLPALAADPAAVAPLFVDVAKLIEAAAAMPAGGAIAALVTDTFAPLVSDVKSRKKLNQQIAAADFKGGIVTLLAVRALDEGERDAFRARFLETGSRRLGQLSFNDVLRVGPLAVTAQEQATHGVIGTLECLARALLRTPALSDDVLAEVARVYVENCDALLGANFTEQPEDVFGIDAEAAIAAASVAFGLDDSERERLDGLMEGLAEDRPAEISWAELVDGRGEEPNLLHLIGTDDDERDAALEDLRTFFDAVGNDDRARGTAGELRYAALQLVCAARKIRGHGVRAMDRIAADFEAILDREADVSGTAARVRAARPSSLARELAALDGLPVEAYPSLVAHVDTEEVRLLVKRAERMQQRDRRHALRDAIFCCVENGHIQLLKDIARSDAAGGIVEDVIRRLAIGFRMGEVGRVFPDAFAAALRERKPVEDVLKVMHPEAVPKPAEEVVLAAPAPIGGPPEPAHLVKKVPGLLRNLQSVVVPGQGFHGANLSTHRAVFDRVTDALRRGTWPNDRYAGPEAARLLTGWTPAQVEAWRTPTPVGEATVDEASPKQLRAAVLLRGIGRGLQQTLGDAEVARLVATHAERSARLEVLPRLLGAVERGSPDHHKLVVESRRLRADSAVADLLVLVEEDAARGPRADAQKLLRGARPLLPALLKVFEARGLRGYAAALCEAMQGVPTNAVALGEHYATDTDSITGFLTPYGGDSCLSARLEHETKNAPALVEFIANPGILMDWTFSGENPRTRQLLRKVDLTTPNAPRCAAFVLDVARGTDSQKNHGTAREHKLASRCALAKAKAMGVPAVSAMPGFDDVAHEAGFSVLVPNGGATVVLDRGLTSVHHAETMPAAVYGPQYFDARGKLVLALAGSVVAIPPGWSPA